MCTQLSCIMSKEARMLKHVKCICIFGKKNCAYIMYTGQNDSRWNCGRKLSEKWFLLNMLNRSKKILHTIWLNALHGRMVWYLISCYLCSRMCSSQYFMWNLREESQGERYCYHGYRQGGQWRIVPMHWLWLLTPHSPWRGIHYDR